MLSNRFLNHHQAENLLLSSPNKISLHQHYLTEDEFVRITQQKISSLASPNRRCIRRNHLKDLSTDITRQENMVRNTTEKLLLTSPNKISLQKHYLTEDTFATITQRKISPLESPNRYLPSASPNMKSIRHNHPKDLSTDIIRQENKVRITQQKKLLLTSPNRRYVR